MLPGLRILVGMLRVRSRAVGGWLLAGGLLATSVVGACADKKGALMLAITTDMKAPKDVNAVAVSITTDGLVKASFIGRVTPQGDILLPGTLAIVEPDNKNAVIRIRVMAFQNQKPRVIRDVRTTAPPDGRTALLRIPLNFVNDGKVAGDPLPDGLVPTPVPGTEGLSPPVSAVGSGTPATGDAGAVGTKDLSPSGGDFDFMLNFQPKDCLNPQDETIIDGECRDSYIDPASLPDFDAEQLGDSTGETGACFDLARCFAGAVGVGGQGTDGKPDGGMIQPGPVDAGSGGSATDASAPVDAGAQPQPFKDFRPAAVTFNKSTCTIQLNGADPARLNIAIVTPDTGECVRAGECYVPIDRGATGWKDDGSGNVQLPSYLCKFLDSNGLRLATSSEVCAAKVESNPICTPKAGDDAGIYPPIADSGKPVAPFGFPDDFVSSVVVVGGTLYFAGSSRQAIVNLADPLAQPVMISSIAVAGSAHLPWRFGPSFGMGALTLSNSSDTGYIIGGPNAQPIKFGQAGTIAGVNVGPAFAWISSAKAPNHIFLQDPLGTPTLLDIPIVTPTALGGTNLEDVAIVGDASGTVSACKLSASQGQYCGTAATVTGQVDSVVVSGDFAGYALSKGGVYRIDVNPGDMSATQKQLVNKPLVGIDEPGVGYFPHTVAVSGKCVIYSSSVGLEYVVDDPSLAGGVLVAANPNQPILGVAVGPQSAGGNAAYYSVYAPKSVGGALTAGGVYRAALPAVCTSTSAGTDAGAGVDASVAPCDAVTCPTGCCTQAKVCLPSAQQMATQCGSSGNACTNCGAGACIPNGSGGTCS